MKYLKKPKFKKGSLYLFRWHDASTSTGWRSYTGAMAGKPSIIENVGFFMGETDSEYIFHADKDISVESYNNVMYRPKSLITYAKRLKI